jgi:hypothetical protein
VLAVHEERGAKHQLLLWYAEVGEAAPHTRHRLCSSTADGPVPSLTSTRVQASQQHASGAEGMRSF